MDEFMGGFTHQDNIFLRAIALGCTPLWDGFAWQCRCPRIVHGVSTTYTVVTYRSLERASVELGGR